MARITRKLFLQEGCSLCSRPLNCTVNAVTQDNGENNHCEWGVISRDGWAVYDDSENFVLDSNDWWVPTSTNISVSQQNIDAKDLYGFFHGAPRVLWTCADSLAVKVMITTALCRTLCLWQAEPLWFPSTPQAVSVTSYVLLSSVF
jgi:hypothetical protein